MRRIGGSAQLGIVVLTFPGEWRPYLTPAVCLEIEARFRARLLVWGVATFGGELGGRSFWHPCGDKCAACGAGKSGAGHNSGMGREGKCSACGAVAPYKPHLNILIPSVAILPDGEVRQLRMHLGPKQLAALHQIARAQLAEIAEVIGEDVEPWRQAERLLHPDGSFRPPRKANIYYAWRGTEAKIAHSIRYFGRVFPAWRNAMPHLGRDFGLLAGQDRAGESRRKDYREAIRKHVPETAQEQKCPCCDANMENVGVLARVMADEWRWGAIDLDAARAVEARQKEG